MLRANDREPSQGAARRTIRALRFTDLPAVEAIERLAAEGQVAQGSDGVRSWPSGVARAVGWWLPRRRRYTYVSVESGQIYGLVEARPRTSASQWEITRLVATSNPPDDVWIDLLSYLCVAAGNKGVQKIFARVDDGSDWLPIFHRVGFYRYAGEQVWLADTPFPAPPPGSLPGLRYALSRDAFPLLQLYSTVTPKNVQHAEGLRARDWDQRAKGSVWTRVAGLGGQSAPGQGWVVERDMRMVAWLRLQRLADGTQMDVLVHPEYPDLVEPLLRFGAHTAGLLNRGPLYCPVRDYQGGIVGTLELLGFHPKASQSLLVKQTVVHVLQRRLMPALRSVPRGTVAGVMSRSRH